MAKSTTSHDPLVTAHAAGATVAIIYVACSLLYLAAPGLVAQVSRAWFHTVNYSFMDGRTVTVGSFLLGVISASAAAWLIGYLFGTLYSKFEK